MNQDTGTAIAALASTANLTVSLTVLMALVGAALETRNSDHLAKWRWVAIAWATGNLLAGLWGVDQQQPISSALLLASTAVCTVTAILGFTAAYTRRHAARHEEATQ